MENLSEQEQELIKLLEKLETIDFDTIELEVETEHNNCKVVLSSEKSSYENGRRRKEKECYTKIDISSTDGCELSIGRKYHYRLEDGEFYWEGTNIEHNGYERLLNGDVVFFRGYSLNKEDPLASIEKFQIRKYDGKAIKIFKLSADQNMFEIAGNLFVISNDTIKIYDDKKTENYYYDRKNKTCYIESKEGKTSLNNTLDNLNNAESKLNVLKHSLKKTNIFFEESEALEIDNSYHSILKNITNKKKQILLKIKMAEKFEKLLEDKRFPLNVQWTNFSDQDLKKISAAIEETIRIKEQENKLLELEEKATSLSDEEIKYILKKYQS